MTRGVVAVLAVASTVFAATPTANPSPAPRAKILSVQIVLTSTTSSQRWVTTLAPGSLTRIRMRGSDYRFRVDIKNLGDRPILQSKANLTISDDKIAAETGGAWSNIVATEALPDLAPKQVASVVFVGHWRLPYASQSTVRIALRPALAKPKLYSVTFTL